MNSVTLLFSDGASKGNPGPGGWGYILADSDRVRERGGFIPSTTNNRMEMLSVIEGLCEVASEARTIRVFSDSSYLINGITRWVHHWERNDWKTKEGKNVANRDLWERLLSILRSLPKKSSLSWEKVEGHAGIPGNERADQIAAAYSELRSIELYDGSRADYPIDLDRLDPQTSGGPVYLSFVDGEIQRHSDWSSCEKRVKGKPGAKFKKVRNTYEEQETLRSWGVASK